MVASVDHDQPLGVDQVGSSLVARHGLDHRDVHDLGTALLPAADLPDVEAQVRRQSLAPPGKQRLAVDEDILTEVTGWKRNRVYRSPRIMDAVYGPPDDAMSDIEG